MTKESRVFALAALLGAVSGAVACSVFAYYVFSAHVVFASVVGVVVGALVGCSGESIFEAAVVCVINGVLIWLMLSGFAKARSPSSTHEFTVLLIVTALLGGAIGRLAGSLTKGL